MDASCHRNPAAEETEGIGWKLLLCNFCQRKGWRPYNGWLNCVIWQKAAFYPWNAGERLLLAMRGLLMPLSLRDTSAVSLFRPKAPSVARRNNWYFPGFTGGLTVKLAEHSSVSSSWRKRWREIATRYARTSDAFITAGHVRRIAISAAICA